MISLITPYFLKQNNKSPYSSKIKYSFPVCSITHDNVCFEAKKDLLDCTNAGITRKVRQAVTDESNEIGYGGSGVVYRIPESNYCVKIYGDNISDFGVWNFNVSNKDKVNHVIAKAENKSEIMRLIPGEALTWTTDISEIFSLPNKCYKDLIMQIVNAEKYGMRFDICSKNIIYNKDTQSFTAIDFVEASENNLIFSPIYQVYDALHDFRKTPEAKCNNRILFCKIMDTVLDELSKQSKPCFPIEYDDVKLIIDEISQDDNFYVYNSFADVFQKAVELKKLKLNEINSEDKLSLRIFCLKILLNDILKKNYDGK